MRESSPATPRDPEHRVPQPPPQSSPDPLGGADLIPAVYDELKQVAQRCLANEPPGLTLQATALVHEAYMRLGGDGRQWQNRRCARGAGPPLARPPPPKPRPHAGGGPAAPPVGPAPPGPHRRSGGDSVFG